MSPIVTVSLAAFDMLWEELRLGAPPYPFQIPSYGETYDERARIRSAVHVDLERRGITDRGRAVPEVAGVLALLARPHIQLDTISTVDVRQESGMLRAMAAARGHDAVLAVQEGQLVRLERTKDTALAAGVVGLLPPAHPGPGREISLPASMVGVPEPANGRHAAPATRRTAESASKEQRKALAEMMEPEVLRLGQIGVGPHDGRRLPGMSWFDNEGGRYFSVVSRGPDGQDWATVAPGDASRMVYRLGEMIRTAR
jgi:ESX secretion-associated protein EspG